MPKPINNEAHYIPGLDGLRTIAVAAVILYHLHIPGAVGGLLGVGVFFTLSGFLITSNLMRAWDSRGSLSLPRFWLRRFRRLMPAGILTVFVTLLLTALLRRDQLSNWGMEGLSALFYVNNWYVIGQEKSYFDTFSGPSPLSHMWSLSVEEQFYLVWPVVLLALLSAFRKRWLVTIVTAVLAAASFALMFLLASPGVDPTRVYEGTDTRAGGMLLGACLALWLSHRQASGKSILPNHGVAAVAGALGVAGILAMVVLVPQESLFLYRGGILLLTVASVLAIFGVLRPDGLWNRVLGWAPLRWLGERSFGIYLWHMPIIAFLPQPWFDQHRLVASLFTIIGAVVLAALSWSLIEDPIRRHGVIGPFRQWRQHRASVRERTQVDGGGAAENSVEPLFGSPSEARRFPLYFLTASSVALAAVVIVSAPTVAVNPDPVAPQGVPQAMTVNEEDRAAAAAATETMTATPAAPTGTSAATTSTQKAAAPAMSCTTVVHVGDSTSIGMFAANQVPNSSDLASVRYKEFGADNVVDSVFGARSTVEGWEAPDGSASYPSAVASVEELLKQHKSPSTCWVIATGVNDAANMAVGAAVSGPERIAKMMNLLKDQNVLWATVRTNTDVGAYANANMERFNRDLRDAQAKYPKLRIYDWAAESRPEWFAAGDFAHYGAVGNAERSKRFAAALAQAFPAELQGKPAKAGVVGSGR